MEEKYEREYFCKFLEKMWLAFTLIALSCICYAGIAHTFPLFMARLGDLFHRPFVWLLIGMLVSAVITATGRINQIFCNFALLLYFIAFVGVLFGQLLFGSFIEGGVIPLAFAMGI